MVNSGPRSPGGWGGSRRVSTGARRPAGYLRYIEWDTEDDFASRLKLRQYPDIAPVVIDPRFGWGAPVVVENSVPVEAIVNMWLAGDSIAEVAYEYELEPAQVESICRVWRAAA